MTWVAIHQIIKGYEKANKGDVNGLFLDKTMTCNDSFFDNDSKKHKNQYDWPYGSEKDTKVISSFDEVSIKLYTVRKERISGNGQLCNQLPACSLSDIQFDRFCVINDN